MSNTPVPVTIDSQAISDFIASFNKTDFAALNYDQYKVVDFIGFDAFKVVEALMKKARDDKISLEDLKDDILWILVICLKKGSVTKNNKDKMSKEGKEQVTRLMLKYGMQYTAGKNAAPDIITFTRVLAAFPVGALKLMKHVGSRPVPAGPFGSSVIPSFMQHQIFASVLPRNINRDVLVFVKTLITAYSCDTSSIPLTNRVGGIKTEDLQKIASQQVTFIQAAFLAAYPGEGARTKYVADLDWKLIFTDKTKELYNDMKKYWYKDLPDLDWTVVDAEGRKIFTGAKTEESSI